MAVAVYIGDAATGSKPIAITFRLEYVDRRPIYTREDIGTPRAGGFTPLRGVVTEKDVRRTIFIDISSPCGKKGAKGATLTASLTGRRA